MPTTPINNVIHYLRSTVLPERPDLTDGQLLECFLNRRDPAALEVLVRRHGAMVWGVCRRLLRNDHDAEDAFQATFLVLIRKAASVCPQSKVANWLYGVAHQTALKARATTEKRRARERPMTNVPEPAAMERNLWNDLQPVLDQEVSRLPEKYRTVIVVCELEGNTLKEAARQLGCPAGTVASRLARARAMLAKRLGRHGLAVSGGALATVLSENMASASVSISVVSSTIKAASLLAAWEAAATGAISVKLAALTEGVMKAMLLNKLRAAIAVVLILGFVATGATILTCRTAAGHDDKKPTAENPVKSPAKQEKDKETATARAQPAPGASKNILQNAGFEEGGKSPAHWSQGAEIDGVEYIWDKKTAKKGKASLCLHKTAMRYFPIAQWYQVVDRKGDKEALRVSAQVKAEKVTKAIIDVIFLDQDGEMIEHKWASYIGAKEATDPPTSHDWKEYTGRVKIPKAAKKIQIGLQIYGPGKVWFDEVRAEYTK
jgi:RNA polymerase sigma-70 factor (ECF subfamily)